jgi:hypothetical protein
MRCTKCGFVSFDYRSECGKCGTGLSEARDILGFSSTKPEIPFLLGGLLKDYEPSVSEEQPAAAANVAPSFDFGDDLGGFRQVEEISHVPDAPSLNPDEGEEDYSLLDLSDEELELLIDKDSPDGAEKRPDFLMDLDSDEKSSAPEYPAQTQSSEPDHPGDLIPRFERAEPEEKTKAPQAKAPEETATLPEASAKRLEKTDPQGEAADDFVIELSENDLQNLLLELDSSQKKEDQEEKESAAPRPKSDG